jgi:hypothetical protein
MFSGLASTPSISDKDKKTTLTLKDYLTLFNSDIYINWTRFEGKKVFEYIQFIFDCWKEQVDVGMQNILIDVSGIQELDLDPTTVQIDGAENVLAYDLILDAIIYYDLYCETKLDIENKALTFYFKKALLNSAEIKLSDFGVDTIEKSFGDFNRVNIYDYQKFGIAETWALNQKNNVVKITASTDLDTLVYPTKSRNYFIEDVSVSSHTKARYEALTDLAKNRYQENIDLDAIQYKSILDLTTVDFSYKIAVYTNEGFYRDLPVGEIQTDSKGTYIVKLGYRVQELTQEL